MARKKQTVEPDIIDELHAAAPLRNSRNKVFADIAARATSFKPARETLKRVRVVPTIFPDLDLKLQVGGWPIERVGLVHGPSAAGKTLLCHGLGLSFLRRGHMYCLVDAEMTTPMSWVETLLGDQANNPAFLASRPKSYEQVVDDVRNIANDVAEKRESGKLPPDTSALFVIDSIRKLVPEDIQDRIRKMGAEGEKGSVDGYGGRAAQMRAALNAAWLDELVPLMYHTGCTIILVGRESEDTTATVRDRQFGKDWKLTGGKGLFFDSSLVCRVSQGGYTYVGPESDKKIVGERHLVEIVKTKVAGKQDRIERAYFNTTLDGLFDRARDLLLVAEKLSIVKRSGSWLSFGGKRWQGDAKFVDTVAAEELDSLEGEIRKKIATTKADTLTNEAKETTE